jgi:hypothetical protein
MLSAAKEIAPSAREISIIWQKKNQHTKCSYCPLLEVEGFAIFLPITEEVRLVLFGDSLNDSINIMEVLQ